MCSGTTYLYSDLGLTFTNISIINSENWWYQYTVPAMATYIKIWKGETVKIEMYVFNFYLNG